LPRANESQRIVIPRTLTHHLSLGEAGLQNSQTYLGGCKTAIDEGNNSFFISEVSRLSGFSDEGDCQKNSARRSIG